MRAFLLYSHVEEVRRAKSASGDGVLPDGGAGHSLRPPPGETVSLQSWTVLSVLCISSQAGRPSALVWNLVSKIVSSLVSHKGENEF